MMSVAARTSSKSAVKVAKFCGQPSVCHGRHRLSSGRSPVPAARGHPHSFVSPAKHTTSCLSFYDAGISPMRLELGQACRFAAGRGCTPSRRSRAIGLGRASARNGGGGIVRMAKYRRWRRRRRVARQGCARTAVGTPCRGQRPRPFPTPGRCFSPGRESRHQPHTRPKNQLM
jgi:hypothetical protein